MKFYHLVYAVPDHQSKTVHYGVLRFCDSDRALSCLRKVPGAVKISIFKAKHEAEADAQRRNEHGTGIRFYRLYFL